MATPSPKPLPGIPFPDAESIPPLFAMKLSGDCLAPELNDGDIVQFAKHEPYSVGDFCIFVMRPELVAPGGLQCLIKRLTMAPPRYVRLPFREHPNSNVATLVLAEQLSPRRQYAIRCDSLLAIMRFVGTADKSN